MGFSFRTRKATEALFLAKAMSKVCTSPQTNKSQWSWKVQLFCSYYVQCPFVCVEQFFTQELNTKRSSFSIISSFIPACYRQFDHGGGIGLCPPHLLQNMSWHWGPVSIDLFGHSFSLQTQFTFTTCKLGSNFDIKIYIQICSSLGRKENCVFLLQRSIAKLSRFFELESFCTTRNQQIVT